MDKLAIKCGEYENSLPFPVGGSLTAGCRTGADIQLGDATDDGPLFVTLTNLGGGMIRVVDHEMGDVLVNSAPITEQVFGSPIVLTLSDLGVDLQLAIDLPQVPSSGQSVLPPIPDPASNHSPVSHQPAKHRRKGIMVAGLILAVMGALVFFYRPISQALSSVQLPGTPTAKSTPVSAPDSAPVKAAANNTPTNPAETLLTEGKKLEEDKQIAQAIEKYKGAADLGNAEAWNVLGILTMQGGDSKAPEAFGYFSKAADGGYPRGIYNLGLCYRDGVGTASDPSKAVGLFQKASDLGIPEAMVALAAAYETGTGADAGKAIQWYQKAAGAGNLDAIIALGKAYAEGNGVARDEAKAATLFEQAASKDRADAINNLGVLYANGRGVAKDPAKAKTLYAKAAELGNADARDNLKSLENESAQKRTPPEPSTGSQAPTKGTSPVAESRAESPVATSTPSAEKKSGASAQLTNSRVMPFPDALEKADAGDAYAQAVVSIYYGLGYKTEKDIAKSAAYALKSAAQGHPLGIYRVGSMRQIGEGMAKDEAQGRTLKSKAFDGLNSLSGDPYALTALGVMVFRGDGVRQDKAEAARLYKIAADQGYAPAQYNYASCLISGQGIEKDEQKANEYWQAACQQNYPPALSGPLR